MGIDRRLTATAHPGTRSTIEILGHLHQLSRHLAAGDLEAVFEAAAELPIRCFGVDKSLLLRRTDHGEHCSIVAARNLDGDSAERVRHLCHDIIGSVLCSQSPAIIDAPDSLLSDYPALYLRAGICSLACFPIPGESDPLGVALYMCSSAKSFTVWEAEIMQTLANHISVALQSRHAEKAHLLGNLHQFLVHLRETIFYDADLQSLLDRMLAMMLDLLHADSGSIMLREAGELSVATSRGLTFRQYTELPNEGRVSDLVVAAGKPVLLQGALQEQGVADAIPRPEIVSSMCLPLNGKHRVVGLLNINSTAASNIFGDDDLMLASTLSRYIAIGIENSKLHEATRMQARYMGNLFRIARTITSTLELDRVLDMITDRLCSTISSDVCALFLYQKETGAIRTISGQGIPNGTDQDYIDLALPITKFVRARQQLVNIPDLAAHPSYASAHIARNLELRSLVLIPLAAKRDTIGFIVACRRAINGFPRGITKLLLGLAELAAIAIENAELYERQSGIASIAQRDLMPLRMSPLPGYEIASRYAPAYQVGGDYYDLIRLGENKYGLVIADVSGKDVTAASYIAMCKHSLRALAKHIDSPAHVLQEMNSIIYDNTEPEAFISMFYAILDAQCNSLVYSCAGHEPGILHRLSTRRSENLSTRGILLGIVPDATFSERNTSINRGDILLLYTDGLLDALSSEHQGLAVLKKVVNDAHLMRIDDIADNIHRLAISGHTRRSPDDIALVALRRAEASNSYGQT
jgi:GAF domain-containing protein